VDRERVEVGEEVVVPVADDTDVVTARSEGRALAQRLGFGPTDVTLVATAISEVARNITTFAGQGEIVLRMVRSRDRVGVEVVARDAGPGISDVDAALADGYTTSGGMGLGLPGARRLMDEFTIESRVGAGTTIVLRKWMHARQ